MWESSFEVLGFWAFWAIDQLFDRHFRGIKIFPAIGNQSRALCKELNVLIKVIRPHLHFLKDFSDFPKLVLQGEVFRLLHRILLFF